MGGRKANPKDERTLVDAREHVLYAGTSMTGKTTLARFHAQALADADYDVVVYDPVGTETANGGWPENARVYDNEREFLKALADLRSDDPERPIFVFVDESADIFSHTERDARHIPRRCRHDGVYLRLIVQRPKMLHPDARNQCSIGYAFRMAQDDARMVCADFGHGAEVYTIQLDKGDFLVLESGRADVSQYSLTTIVPTFDQPTKRS
jgi:hypothetical protein